MYRLYLYYNSSHCMACNFVSAMNYYYTHGCLSLPELLCFLLAHSSTTIFPLSTIPIKFYAGPGVQEMWSYVDQYSYDWAVPDYKSTIF